MTFDYVKALINTDRNVPYRTCLVCKHPMVFTRIQWFPHIIGCTCRASGEPTPVRISWDVLRELLEKPKK